MFSQYILNTKAVKNYKINTIRYHLNTAQRHRIQRDSLVFKRSIIITRPIMYSVAQQTKNIVLNFRNHCNNKLGRNFAATSNEAVPFGKCLTGRIKPLWM